MKSPSSVRLSVCQFGDFLNNRSFVFSDFRYDVRSLEHLKTDRAPIFGENSFFITNPMSGKILLLELFG